MLKRHSLTIFDRYDYEDKLSKNLERDYFINEPLHDPTHHHINM